MSRESRPQNLRDARLRRALEHAPDARAEPGAEVRRAVLAAAREAVAGRRVTPAGREGAPWWRRLWHRVWGGAPSSGRRRPWSAAFATVLLAGVVTLLWRGQMPEQVAQVDEAQVAASAGVAEDVPALASQARAPAAVPVPEPAAPPAAKKPAPRVAVPPPLPAPAPPEPVLADAAEPEAPMAWARAWDGAQLLAEEETLAGPAGAERRIRREEAPALAEQLAGLGMAPATVPPLADAPPMAARRERADAAEAAVAAAPAPRRAAGEEPARRVLLWQGERRLGVLEVAGQRWRFVPSAPGAAGELQGWLAPPAAQALRDALAHLPAAQADGPAQR